MNESPYKWGGCDFLKGRELFVVSFTIVKESASLLKTLLKKGQHKSKTRFL
jgi:hypothetical protein